jgi:hypothetical protein
MITAYALFALAEVGLEIENVSFFPKRGGTYTKQGLLGFFADHRM